MKNFKKLFAIVATAAMLSTIMPTASFAAGYSDELKGAYDYAYEVGATTQSTIDSANMYGNLIRAHAAKILVNYAKEVLDRTPDTSVEVNFSDIADQSSELQAYIVEAAQLGIMGVNPDGSVADKFNPSGVVTRAQFGTILSRILYGDKYEGGTPYYKNHLEALSEAGIMKNISTPDSIEVRGYVFLMLERAADETPIDETCSSAEVIFACTMGTSDCPAECEDEVVSEETNGNLSVKLGTSEGAKIPYGVSSLEVATYKFTADEDVRIDSVILKRGGYSEDDTLTNVALFLDGGRISKVNDFNSDDEATLSITNGYTIKAGQTVEFAVNATVGGSGAAGDTFNVALKSISSTAEDVDYASDLTSDTFEVLSKENGSVTVDLIADDLENPKAGETEADLFSFSIEGDNDQDSTFKSITFKEGDGSVDYSDDLENFQLLADGEVIAEADSMNGKYLSFNIEDGYAVLEDETVDFIVQADVVGGAGKTINFVVEDSMDIVVIGDTYDVAMTITGATGETETASISAGKVTISKVTATAGDLIADKDNVFLGAFTITNNDDSALNLVDMTVSFSDWTDGTNELFDNVKVKLGSTSASPIDLDASANGQIWTGDDLGKAIGSKLTVYVYGDTNADVDMDVISAKMTLSSLVIEEDDSEDEVDDITPSTLTWSTMDGATANADLKQVTLESKTFAQGSSDVEAISFKVEAGDSYGTKIKKVTFKAHGTGIVDGDTVISATLYNGSEEVSTVSSKSGSIVFDDDFTIEAGKTNTYTLKIDLADTPESTGFYYTLSGSDIDAVDTSSSADDIEFDGLVTGRTITVANVGDLVPSYSSTTTNNKYAKDILAGDEATIAEYSLYSKYESVSVGEVAVNFSADVEDAVNEVVMTYNGEEYTTSTWSGNSAVFENIDLDTTTSKSSLVVKLSSKTINEGDGEAVAGAKINSISFNDVEGSEEIDDSTYNTASNTFNIVPVTVNPAVTSTAATTAKFTLTTANGSNTDTDGDEAIATLSGIVFNIDTNNGLTALTIKNGTNTVGSASFTGTYAGAVTVSITGAYATLDGEGTETYTVLATYTNSDSNYNVSLAGVTYTSNAASGTIAASIGDAKDLLSK